MGPSLRLRIDPGGPSKDVAPESIAPFCDSNCRRGDCGLHRRFGGTGGGGGAGGTAQALLAEARLPKPVELPRPSASAVVLPDDDGKGDGNAPILVRLAQDPPPGTLTVRAPARATAGSTSASARRAETSRGARRWAAAEGVSSRPTSSAASCGCRSSRTSAKSRSRSPRPARRRPVELVTPTTLVEVRGRQIFLNGEPFLIKGATSRNLRAADALYARSLGINTLRGQDALPDCERYGFMSIASLGFGSVGSKQAMNATDAEFEATLAGCMDWLKKNIPPVIASPNTLIVQLGNEKTPGSNKEPGEAGPAEPLNQAPERRPPAGRRPRRRQAACAALPVGYANQDFGFLAPDCMDVYMHNSFLTKDRYGRTWDEILRWQGCLPPDGPAGQGRPFVNSEFGANRYLCQSYHGGPNNPVLEKVHAWNFPNRWAEFMEHGTAGGAVYCLYDLDEPRDQGSSRFGILTFEGQPKLACWEIGRMWRDFEVEVRPAGLVLNYRRDYRARDCRLTVTTPDGKSVTRTLDDFAPRSSRTIALAELSLAGATEIRWQLDFTTHAGLPNQARGAGPRRRRRMISSSVSRVATRTGSSASCSTRRS